MGKKYSKEMYEYIKANIKGVRIQKITDMVNDRFGVDMTVKKMKSYLKNHKLGNGLKHNMKGLNYNSIFTPEQKDFIKQNYKGIGNIELTELLNKTFNTEFTTGQIKRYKNVNNYNSGLTGRFEKGHISHNKGKKMPSEVYEKVKKTMFKKGHIPVNHKPVGSERIDAKDGYTYVKVAEPNKFVLKHRYIWEQTHGEIPKDHIIIFLDGNKQNFAIDNLECISRSENSVMNHLKLRAKDAEITKIAINIARIKNKIGVLKKRGKNGKR